MIPQQQKLLLVPKHNTEKPNDVVFDIRYLIPDTNAVDALQKYSVLDKGDAKWYKPYPFHKPLKTTAIR